MRRSANRISTLPHACRRLDIPAQQRRRLLRSNYWTQNSRHVVRRVAAGERTRNISPRVRLSPPRRPQQKNHRSSLRYSAIDGVDYFPVDRDGNPCRYPGVRGYQKRVSNQMRDERVLLYLGLDRQANSQVRTTQWTLYGRLLRKIEGTIPADVRKQFALDVEAAVDAHVREVWPRPRKSSTNSCAGKPASRSS